MLRTDETVLNKARLSYPNVFIGYPVTGFPLKIRGNDCLLIPFCVTSLHEYFPKVELDEYVIMPNHVHGIIIITDGRDLINQIPTKNFPLMKNPKVTLGKIIRYYKARSSKYIHDSGYVDFQWQSLFYDRIIRSDKELIAIRDYIADNPLKWCLDEENPNKT